MADPPPLAPPPFEDIYRAERERVLALAYQMTGDPAAAEDVAQETFITVHRALPGFRGESKLSTWIYRIALRLAMRHRKRGRRRATVALTAEHAAGLAASPDPDVPALREEVERVRAALVELSPDHRAVLSLFAIEGLSHDEIADVLGIPTGTVWSRLHTARKKLKDKLRPAE